jgi:hypothetical protein
MLLQLGMMLESFEPRGRVIMSHVVFDCKIGPD